jgi:putative ABC transport system permease protein
MTTFLGLAAKNIRRNPVRTSLTVLGVATAIVGFVLLRTVISAWNVGVEHAAKDRIGTRHKVSFIIPLPRRYVDVIRETDGVEAATWANWFGGKNPNNEEDFFATIAVDPRSFLEVYDEIELPAAQRDAWFANRRGAVIGSSLAQRLHVGVGDRFTLKGTIFPGNWEFVVSGIYTASRRSIDQSQFIFHWDYLNESLPEAERDHVGWIVSRVDNPRGSAALSQRIDRVFDEQDEPTLTMSERP